MDKITLRFRDMYVEALHASSKLDLAKGMRGRSSGVMLLEFPDLGKYQLDMALVPEPLHLYYLDEEGTVIDLEKALPWSWKPGSWSTTTARKKFKYVVESFHPLQLEAGDKVDLIHFH